mgnify:CR=1 FL=1
MRSTFMGLEASKRGLYTQQSALYTTGHNVSNANTEGYSRQRVNMQATAGYPGVGLNAPTVPGFIGTGVEAGSIQRVRDQFIDKQFRQETNKLGYWQSRSNAIEQLEDVMNEPSEFGLQRSLSLFWQSLQDVAAHPENGGTRAVAIDRGVAVAESFNYMNASLKDIQRNLRSEIEVSVTEINSILDQIAGLNKQILEVEPNGYMPNDLYDARDTLIDELAEFFPVELDYTKSGGRALASAEGLVTVSVRVGGETIQLVNGIDRVNVEANYAQPGEEYRKELEPFTSLSVSGMTEITEPVAKKEDGSLQVVAKMARYTDMPSTGKFAGIVDSYGYLDNGVHKGLYPDHLNELDRLAQAFGKAFNEQHARGISKNKGLATEASAFFTTKDRPDGNIIAWRTITAENIQVNEKIQNDPSLLRAASHNAADGEEGNGANAKALADIQHLILSDGPDRGGLNGASIQTFFEGMIGELGVLGQQAVRNEFNATTMKESIEYRRASVMSVSLDEEMTDMIRFQQAYNASARMITAVDETLDKIINGMGRVGL